MAIGTVKSAISFVDISGFEYSRKVFIGYANAWVCFAIFQQNIIFWLVLFDELILYQKSIFLGINNGIGYIMNL